MKMNKYIVNTIRLVHASGLSSSYPGAILVHIRRAALHAVALGKTIFLATGCSRRLLRPRHLRLHEKTPARCLTSATENPFTKTIL